MNRARTLVLAALVSTTVLAPVSAQAATWHHQDATHDVMTTDDEGEFVPSPDTAKGDITSITVSHNPRKVVVTEHFRDLTASDQDLGIHMLLLRTPHRRVGITIDASEHPSGTQEMESFKDEKLRCHGLRHRIDYSAHKLVVSVPRRCLGRPRWVQALGVTLRGEVTGATEEDMDFSFFEDLTNQKGLPKNYTSRSLVWSPRIHRG